MIKKVQDRIRSRKGKGKGAKKRRGGGAAVGDGPDDLEDPYVSRGASRDYWIH